MPAMTGRASADNMSCCPARVGEATATTMPLRNLYFGSLKKERIRRKIYKTRDDARAAIFDYIEVFYSKKRRHSHLGGLSPKAFELATSDAR